MIGYAGALLLDTAYRTQRDELQAKFSQLSRPVPPPYYPGLVRAHVSPLAIPVNASQERLPDDVQTYLESVQSFLVRWELAALVTWDLPLPQGPVELPAGMLPSVLGTSPTVSHVPSYASPPSDVDLRKETRARQKLNTEAAGQKMQHPRGGRRGRDDSPSTEETVFRMWLVELAIRRRYGNPRGLIARLVPELADFPLSRIAHEHVRAVGSPTRAVRRTPPERSWRVPFRSPGISSNQCDPCDNRTYCANWRGNADRVRKASLAPTCSAPSAHSLTNNQRWSRAHNPRLTGSVALQVHDYREVTLEPCLAWPLDPGCPCLRFYNGDAPRIALLEVKSP